MVNSAPDAYANTHNDIYNNRMRTYTVSSVTSRMISWISSKHTLKVNIKYFKRTSRIAFLSDKKAFNT